MRYFIFAISILLFAAITAHAKVRVENALPGVNIDFNTPTCPQRIELPGYPDCYDNPMATL